MDPPAAGSPDQPAPAPAPKPQTESAEKNSEEGQGQVEHGEQSTMLSAVYSRAAGVFSRDSPSATSTAPVVNSESELVDKEGEFVSPPQTPMAWELIDRDGADATTEQVTDSQSPSATTKCATKDKKCEAKDEELVKEESSQSTQEPESPVKKDTQEPEPPVKKGTQEPESPVQTEDHVEGVAPAAPTIETTVGEAGTIKDEDKELNVVTGEESDSLSLWRSAVTKVTNITTGVLGATVSATQTSAAGVAGAAAAGVQAAPAALYSASAAALKSAAHYSEKALPQDSDGVERVLKKALAIVLHYVVDGIEAPYMRIPPVPERATELLEKHKGNIEAAVEEVVREGAEESKLDLVVDLLLSLVPYSGAVALIIKSQWKPLRNIAVIACLYGNDCNDGNVQSTMLWCLVPPGGDSGAKANDGADDGNSDANSNEGGGAGSVRASRGPQSSVVAQAAQTAVAKAIVYQVIKRVGTTKLRLFSAKAFWSGAVCLYQKAPTMVTGGAHVDEEGKKSREKSEGVDDDNEDEEEEEDVSTLSPERLAQVHFSPDGLHTLALILSPLCWAEATVLRSKTVRRIASPTGSNTDAAGGSGEQEIITDEVDDDEGFNTDRKLYKLHSREDESAARATLKAGEDHKVEVLVPAGGYVRWQLTLERKSIVPGMDIAFELREAGLEELLPWELIPAEVVPKKDDGGERAEGTAVAQEPEVEESAAPVMYGGAAISMVGDSAAADEKPAGAKQLSAAGKIVCAAAAGSAATMAANAAAAARNAKALNVEVSARVQPTSQWPEGGTTGQWRAGVEYGDRQVVLRFDNTYSRLVQKVFAYKLRVYAPRTSPKQTAKAIAKADTAKASAAKAKAAGVQSIEKSQLAQQMEAVLATPLKADVTTLVALLIGLAAVWLTVAKMVLAGTYKLGGVVICTVTEPLRSHRDAVAKSAPAQHLSQEGVLRVDVSISNCRTVCSCLVALMTLPLFRNITIHSSVLRSTLRQLLLRMLRAGLFTLVGEGSGYTLMVCDASIMSAMVMLDGLLLTLVALAVHYLHLAWQLWGSEDVGAEADADSADAEPDSKGKGEAKAEGAKVAAPPTRVARTTTWLYRFISDNPKWAAFAVFMLHACLPAMSALNSTTNVIKGVLNFSFFHIVVGVHMGIGAWIAVLEQRAEETKLKAFVHTSIDQKQPGATFNKTAESNTKQEADEGDTADGAECKAKDGGNDTDANIEDEEKSYLESLSAAGSAAKDAVTQSSQAALEQAGKVVTDFQATRASLKQQANAAHVAAGEEVEDVDEEGKDESDQGKRASSGGARSTATSCGAASTGTAPASSSAGFFEMGMAEHEKRVAENSAKAEKKARARERERLNVQQVTRSTKAQVKEWQLRRSMAWRVLVMSAMLVLGGRVAEQTAANALKAAAGTDEAYVYPYAQVHASAYSPSYAKLHEASAAAAASAGMEVCVEPEPTIADAGADSDKVADADVVAEVLVDAVSSAVADGADKISSEGSDSTPGRKQCFAARPTASAPVSRSSMFHASSSEVLVTVAGAWANQALVQLLKQREVLLWMLGADKAVVAAFGSVATIIGLLIQIPRHGTAYIDEVTPEPFACGWILTARRLAVTVGMMLGVAQAVRSFSTIAALCTVLGVVGYVLQTHSEITVIYGAHLATWRRLELLMPAVSRKVWLKLEGTMEKIETAVAGTAAKGVTNMAVGIGSWVMGKALTKAVVKAA
jgi:hypothetical protein